MLFQNKKIIFYTIFQKINLFYIEHKNYIGGRYSVLSEVGMVPANLMGLNIKKLRAKTLRFLKGSNRKFLQNSTIKLSNLLITNKFNNLVFLNYCPKLEKFLFGANS